jgi:outer membrane protein assembly factor BamB
MQQTFVAMIGYPFLLASATSVLAEAGAVPETVQAIWPGFRGPGGYGHAGKANPPVTWDVEGGKNIAWKVEIERHGMSSPIVSGDRVIVTAADHLLRQVLCFEASTGKPLWELGVDAVAEQDLPRVMEETGYAAPTPATDGQHVVALFATGELVCIDLQGNRVWAKQVGVPKNHYGHSSSLIINDGMVIVQYDQGENAKVLAFETATGNLSWEVGRESISWSSPILIDNSGRAEVVLTDSKSVGSYDPKTGKPLWKVECLDGEVAASAAYSDGIIFVASEGSAATAIDIRKTGEKPEVIWQWDEALPDATSPLAYEGLLVVPTAFGVVTCLDAETGQVHWEHEFDQGFNSSPIHAGERVYVTDMSGATQIFKTGKGFELLGTASVGEPVYATPAFVGGRIYIRGVTHLFCIEQEK